MQSSTSQAQVKHKSSSSQAQSRTSQASVRHQSSTSQAQSSTSQAPVKHQSCASQAPGKPSQAPVKHKESPVKHRSGESSTSSSRLPYRSKDYIYIGWRLGGWGDTGLSLCVQVWHLRAPCPAHGGIKPWRSFGSLAHMGPGPYGPMGFLILYM